MIKFHGDTAGKFWFSDNEVPTLKPLCNTIVYIWSGVFGLMGRVFANDPGDRGSILGHDLTKTLKMGLDTSLLNTQQYKVCIKGKVEQSREKSSSLPYTSV